MRIGARVAIVVLYPPFKRPPWIRCPRWSDSASISVSCSPELGWRDRAMTRKSIITWRDDPAHLRRPTRRDFLYVGFVGGLGLSLDNFFRMQAYATTTEAGKEPPAKSLIHIFMPGGMAHQESWDPKPYAPIEYRGEMGYIPTKIEGAFFNECLKQTAQIADKITVCRGMTHGEAAHERGTHNMFTGYRPSPALVFPSMGSVISHEYGPRRVRPQRRRPAPADGPPTRRRRSALRDFDLRRLGLARRYQGRHAVAVAAVRPGVRSTHPRPGPHRASELHRRHDFE